MGATRKPIVAANWKMHKTREEARRFVADMAGLPPGVELVICPPFTALSEVKEAIRSRGWEDGSVLLGGQDVHWEASGAFTGEVSPAMLKDAGCSYVIVGHSERRGYFGETDSMVNLKVKAALRAGLKPILCVGETLEQRDAGIALQVVREQLLKACDGLSAGDVSPGDGGPALLVIAYEPVWAIGTGRAATASDALEMALAIRRVLEGSFGAEVAEKARIQYGGSVKPSNAREFAALGEIDGALVGGASLDPGQFLEIAKAWVRD